MSRRLVYGPVPSRRFGLSLGVDLVPYKTCCYDCLYCQLGKTTELTVTRQDFVSREEVLADIRQALSSGPRPDVITLAGSGEPTLYASLGKLVEGIHFTCDIPVLLLTNGALLYHDEVAAEVLTLDILAPSLDAGDQETFELINRPHPDITFEKMLTGVRQVIGKFEGRLPLEVMLAQGVNDSDESVHRIATVLDDLRTDSVDLNTPVRPPPDRKVSACSKKRLEAARAAFGSRARIVAAYSGRQAECAESVQDQRLIIEMISRRPCTVEDISSSLGIPSNLVIKFLDQAVGNCQVLEHSDGQKNFYFRNTE